jgi:hypothetical protein
MKLPIARPAARVFAAHHAGAGRAAKTAIANPGH